MPTYGVIDLGSNSIRLVIYEVKDAGKSAFDHRDFKSIINDKVMAGLSAYIVEGAFSDAGIERAVSVLKGHAKRARYFNCKRLDVFTTAVLRNATNSAQAVAEIEKQTGLNVTVLSARDEAHLGFIGATCDREIKQGTLIDIGGGSTELTQVVEGRDQCNTSLSMGSLSSYATYVSAILPSTGEANDIEVAFLKLLNALPNAPLYHSDVLYGVGGSVRAAAKMHAQLHHLLVRPKVMTADEVHAILALYAAHPNSFAHHALKASAERIHTLVPGCIIVDTLMRALGACTLELCKYGVREGYLLERMLLADVE